MRYLRERSGLSARNLSLLAGLSPSYISKVEAGTIEPSLRAFADIASVLKMTDAEILFIVKRVAKERDA